MSYGIDREINTSMDYRQLLMGLTVKELQGIRKNWGFEGISHLKKVELVEELYNRIPLSLELWLKNINTALYDFLRENLSEEDLLFVDIESEGDFSLLEYFQQYGVVFYGNYEDSIAVYMPDEIKENLRYIFSYKSELRTIIKQNTEIVSMTIGFLVYYGVYPTMKIPEIIESLLTYKVKPYHYFEVIDEFIKAYDIFSYYQGNLKLKYVMDPEWVLQEQNVRDNVDYYRPGRNEIMSAGVNLIPSYNKEYKAIKNYLRKIELSNQDIDDILIYMYLEINNDRSLQEIILVIMEMSGIYDKEKFYKLGDLILAAYNNTRQWVLKGNTAERVHNITNSLDISEDIEDSIFKQTEKNEKVVDINEFRNYKEDSSGTVHKGKEVGRNDPCPCGSGKKYKKCCLKKEQQRELLESKLNQGEELNDKYYSRKEYIEKMGYPLLRIDFFILEIANIVGSIITIYNKYGNIKRIDLNGVLNRVVKKGRELYESCLECKNGCLENTYRPVSLNAFRERGIVLDTFPIELQEETALNFFYLEFVFNIIDIVNTVLIKSEHSEEQALEICQVIIDDLFGFITGNCYEKCGNRCIINHHENAYCEFCTFSIPYLPCPEKGEISYEEIKASEEDINC